MLEPTRSRPKKRATGVCLRGLGAALTIVVCSCAAPESTGPDLILTGGTIYRRASPDNPVSALAIRGSKVVALGNDREIRALAGDATQELAFEDHFVLPGIHDAWIDPETIGFLDSGLDLRSAATVREVQAAVRRAAAVYSEEWLIGRGWDETRWPDSRLPARQHLDEAMAQRPVILFRHAGPAAWLNSVALHAAGIDSGSPDPPGGRILRSPDGNPTGILLGTAVEKARAALPPSNERTRRGRIETGLRAAVAAGLTSIATAPVDGTALGLYRELSDTGDLPLRVHIRLQPEAAVEIDLQEFESTEWLQLRGLGLRLDGGFRPPIAAVAEPYSDGSHGLLLADQLQLEQAREAATAASVPLDLHVQGDTALAMAAELLSGLPSGGMLIGVDLRPERGFEHLGLTAGSVAIVPHRLAHDLYWLTELLGTQRVGRSHAWRSLAAAGLLGAMASDAPAHTLHPMAAAWIGLRRQDLDGYPLDGWHHEEAIDIGLAMRALASPTDEGRKATLEVGSNADLVVWSEDPFGSQPDLLLRAAAMVTIAGGRVVYSRPLVNLPMTQDPD